MPTIKYRSERTCCDSDAPVGVDTRDPAHYHKSAGIYIECRKCGHVHWAERQGADQ